MTDFDKYISPFSWRYGSDEMRHIWSEENKRRIWRWIWVSLAEVQYEYGLSTQEQIQDLRAHMGDVDIKRSLEIESQVHHDLMAEVKTFAEQCPRGGGIIHLGATSVDVKDNTTALQLRDSLALILGKLQHVLSILVEKINRYESTPVIAFTHLQPAEPTTLGYRLAQYAQDLFLDWENISRVNKELKGKGFKGAVGTSASYSELIGYENLEKFENVLSKKLELPFFTVTTQTYPRKQEYQVLSAISGLGASIYKFAFDLRILQSPPIGELAEPFGSAQVGSSAMPFKRNPVIAEKIDSLARMLAQFPRTAWDNAAHSLLERTLDDSANRRSLLPEAFLIADELLVATGSILCELIVDESALGRNLAIYGPFAAIERLLMAIVKAGADRQEMHERLRGHSMQAWEAIQNDEPNPLTNLVTGDQVILDYLSDDDIRTLMDSSGYIGDAAERASGFANLILERFGSL